MPERIRIDGSSLTLERVNTLLDERNTIEVTPDALQAIESSRNVIQDLIKTGRAVYGVNTGFGKFADVRIGPGEIDALQRNLVLSHAAGIGRPLTTEIVRVMLLLKINALAKGFSGCRVELVQTLTEMFNRRLYPIIPEKGSVGSSGDLAPLSHLALGLIGEGEIEFEGTVMPAAVAMKKAGIEPLTLKSKEGLAILNGTQTMTAIGCIAWLRADNLADCADILGSLSLEVLLGTRTAFDERLHAVRNQLGQQDVARRIRNLVRDSPMIDSHIDCGRVQDAYSLRCIPQVHGASRDALTYVKSILEREMNAVTDNPVVFSESGDVLSGGNFHGQPIALSMDFLSIAVSELGSISERRIAHMMDPNVSALPAFLCPNGGVNSGMMITQYLAAALASENKSLSHPASVDSIPTSANKEDHNSMGTISARKALDVVNNVGYILAVEYLCASQAADLRKPLEPAPATKKTFDLLREHVAFMETDRILHRDIETARDLVVSGKLRAAVEKAI